jgi:creatinine amidohydrolase
MHAGTQIRDRRLEWLRPAEIVEEMKARPLIFVPIAPLEYHGPHLPLGTDVLIAQSVALRVADRIGGLVLPPVSYGTDMVRPPGLLRGLGFRGDEYILGMDFPSSLLKGLYLPEEYVALQVRALLTALSEQGFRLIVLINGHGGVNHIALLDRLSAEFTARGPARVLNFIAWASDGDKPQQGLEEGSYGLEVGHADAIEAARIMALNPAAVDLSALPPPGEPLHNTQWAVVDYLTWRGQPTADHTVREKYDPRFGASAEEGEKTFELSASHIAQQVGAALTAMGYSPRA